jgi:fatty acid desaturase
LSSVALERAGARFFDAVDFLGGNAGIEWMRSFLSLYPASTMKKQIVQVSVLQSAKVMAAVYFVTAIPVVVLASLFMSAVMPAGVSIVMLLVMPVAYALGAFIGAALGAWIYNLVAARIGGFEFTTAEVNAAAR